MIRDLCSFQQTQHKQTESERMFCLIFDVFIVIANIYALYCSYANLTCNDN